MSTYCVLDRTQAALSAVGKRPHRSSRELPEAACHAAVMKVCEAVLGAFNEMLALAALIILEVLLSASLMESVTAPYLEWGLPSGLASSVEKVPGGCV
ncbi:hypothetical protein TREES_T100019391 [Tupaia chinensis]|uniref:Uncharacterized protein n=1 Tax=Tupaia chinensis TaxID=246437 RepID=L9KV84_TUPCH|nr:hypothetical protein TREES_T100019391 [Tupaia chinensis]